MQVVDSVCVNFNSICWARACDPHAQRENVNRDLIIVFLYSMTKTCNFPEDLVERAAVILLTMLKTSED
jgi:hypothetical protein